MFLQNKRCRRFELYETELEVGHFIKEQPKVWLDC